jgi:hypothetical protein
VEGSGLDLIHSTTQQFDELTEENQEKFQWAQPVSGPRIETRKEVMELELSRYMKV